MTQVMRDDSGDRELDALLQSASGDDQGAMAIAFDRYRGRLERMVHLRLDPRVRGRVGIEDVVQDVYIEAARRLPKFLQERNLPFFLWLRLITGQKIIEMHRHHGALRRDVGREQAAHDWRRSDSGSAAFARAFAASQTSPSGVAVRHEIEAKIKSAMNALDPIDREVILLRHYEALSNQDTAQTLGITPNAAAQRHFRALKRLKGVLEHFPGELGA